MARARAREADARAREAREEANLRRTASVAAILRCLGLRIRCCLGLQLRRPPADTLAGTGEAE